MVGSLLYVDSSALVKLVVEEAESHALVETLRRWPRQVSSAVTLVEVPRAARRASDAPEVAARADALVDRVGVVFLTVEIARKAASLVPSALRSLDAIHLASALSLGGDLGALATYDDRLMQAASAAGVRVLAPQ